MSHIQEKIIQSKHYATANKSPAWQREEGKAIREGLTRKAESLMRKRIQAVI